MKLLKFSIKENLLEAPIKILSQGTAFYIDVLHLKVTRVFSMKLFFIVDRPIKSDL